MSTRTLILFLAGPLSIAMAVLGLSKSSSPQWTPDAGPPPWKYFLTQMSLEPQYLNRTDAGVSFQGSALCRPHESKIVLRWQAVGEQGFLDQEVTRNYWPTWVYTSGDGTHMYVAGKRRSDKKTVLEKLAIGSPQRVLAYPSGEVTLNGAPITSVTAIFDEATEDRDYIIHVVEDRSGSGKLMVRFFDSMEFAWLDPSTSPATVELIASASNVAADFTNSEFGTYRSNVWTAEHETLGHVYVFHSPDNASVDTLVFYDSDTNGEIDGWDTYDNADWYSSGLYDMDNYADLSK